MLKFLLEWVDGEKLSNQLLALLPEEEWVDTLSALLNESKLTGEDIDSILKKWIKISMVGGQLPFMVA